MKCISIIAHDSEKNKIIASAEQLLEKMRKNTKFPPMQAISSENNRCNNVPLPLRKISRESRTSEDTLLPHTYPDGRIYEDNCKLERKRLKN